MSARNPVQATKGSAQARSATQTAKGASQTAKGASQTAKGASQATWAGQSAKARRAAAAGNALPGVIERAQRLASEWAPTVGRVALGLVLLWFGYHELMQPQLWTGYVPGVSTTSVFAIALVLVHGWALLMLAIAIIAGVLLRLASAISAVLLLEVVISLTITGGLTDISLRDVGVLGLAVMLTAGTRQRAVLAG